MKAINKPYQVVIDFKVLEEILLNHYNAKYKNNQSVSVEIKGIIGGEDNFKMLSVMMTPKPQ